MRSQADAEVPLGCAGARGSVPNNRWHGAAEGRVIVDVLHHDPDELDRNAFSARGIVMAGSHGFADAMPRAVEVLHVQTDRFAPAVSRTVGLVPMDGVASSEVGSSSPAGGRLASSPPVPGHTPRTQRLVWPSNRGDDQAPLLRRRRPPGAVASPEEQAPSTPVSCQDLASPSLSLRTERVSNSTHVPELDEAGCQRTAFPEQPRVGLSYPVSHEPGSLI